MAITKLNKSGRFFAFGCSGARYIWPTWADIVGKDYAEYQNWGKVGAGNPFMFYSLIECNQRNQFTPDDTVIIQWTFTSREDRYVDKLGGWIGAGEIHNQSLYSTDFVKKFACDEGYLIRDLSLIQAAKDLLEKWGVQYEFIQAFKIESLRETDELIKSPALELYADTVSTIKPGSTNVLFGTTNIDVRGLRDIDTKRFYWQLPYESLAGADWPPFEDFLIGNYTCSKLIERELKMFVDNFTNSTYHATPQDYLKWLDIILPNLEISQETREWVKQLRRFRTTEEERAYYLSNMPERFKIKYDI